MHTNRRFLTVIILVTLCGSFSICADESVPRAVASVASQDGLLGGGMLATARGTDYRDAQQPAVEETPPPGQLPANSGQVILQPAESVKMLKWDSNRPYFRLSLNLIRSDGSPAEVRLPEKIGDLRKAIEVEDVVSKKKFTPFYVNNQIAASEIVRNRDILVLFDVSGSMNFPVSGEGRNRFDAAKSAARTIVATCREGDQIAIIPFESRGVKERIRNHRFARTCAEAGDQIEALPKPDSKGNTGLFSATETALEVLRLRKQDDNSREHLLIVLTDGQNDVKPEKGDDRDLLTGEAGLKTVVEKAIASDVTTYTIGIGAPSLELENQLIRIAYPPNTGKYLKAQRAGELKTVLERVQESYSKKLVMTFATDHEEAGKLRELKFKIRLKTRDGQLLASDEIPWVCTTSTDCKPVGMLDRETEARALVNLDSKIARSKPPVSWWSRIGWLSLIATVLSGGIAALWFFVPKLIWPVPASMAGLKRPKRDDHKPSSKKAPAPSYAPAPDRGSYESKAKPRLRFDETRIQDEPSRRGRPRNLDEQ